MPYIGNPPAEKYASYDVQHITTSATSSYVLDKNVANENEIRVVLNNVIQQPGSSYAYTASGNTLTLSAATTSSDKLYVVFTGKAVQTVTPPPSSVGLAQFNATGSPGTNTFLRGDNSWATPSDTSLTLNNNGANKIIAGTATTNTMSGQTNLIYNGNRMGVGGAGASADLGDGIHIKTADAGGGSVDANGSELVIENSSNAGLSILTPNDAKGNIYFADPQANGIGVLRYDHSDNSMRFIANGAEKIRILSSGGITFNGDTATTNALDDYENGSFVPGWQTNGGGLSSVASNYGYYVKVGKIVTVWFGAILGTSSTPNYYYINNAPYQCNLPSGGATGAGQEYAHTAAMQRVWIDDNSTNINVYAYNATVAANAYLKATVTYRTD